MLIGIVYAPKSRQFMANFSYVDAFLVELRLSKLETEIGPEAPVSEIRYPKCPTCHRYFPNMFV
jgi:hypothetical protein